MIRSHARWSKALSAVGLLAAVAGASAAPQGCSCGDSGDAATSGASGGGGAGTGAGSPASATGTGGDAVVGPGGTGAGVPAECTDGCADGEVCSHGTCIPAAPCGGNEDCLLDTHCVGGACLPWGPGEFEASCLQTIAAGVFTPKLKCEFSTPPAGDAFPEHTEVQGTPIVVNYNAPASAGVPSIVAAFSPTPPASGTYTENRGVIRVLRGDTCALEANLGGVDLDGDAVVDHVVSSSTPASADLDGDGVAEIVAYGADGSTLAFTKKAGAWGLLWKGTAFGFAATVCGESNCGGGWAGPSIHDLDDDGKPEVIREGSVFGANGALLSDAPPGYQSYGSGVFPVLANLDEDPAIELTNGRTIWEWTGGAWSAGVPLGAENVDAGHAAVADFGAYGPGAATNAEIAVVSVNNVSLYATDGARVFGPVPVPGPGGGGPPTLSDFDGDGLPEIAVAGQAFYTVYDVDCGANPRPGGTCALGPCDFAGKGATCAAGAGILWSRETQDISSNVTGSSIFDFEADGRSEVIYGDECFTRVYDGRSGDVLFSQYRSSCTWYENPIVADTDGNFRADLVTPSNRFCSADLQGIGCQKLNADGVDAQFPGLRCDVNQDCASGSCVEGLCRCASTAECCASKTEAACTEEGFKCSPPDPDTKGAGNTCRAAHPHGVFGVRVYSDANDRWVRARTIWNQHAYSITNVNEDGTVPKTSAWTKNWEQPGLNNYRQNVPGTVNGTSIGDLTSGASQAFVCNGTEAELSVEVCNRGSDGVGKGVVVGFYAGAEKACEAATTKPLEPGACETVACTWTSPPSGSDESAVITVRPNEDGAIAECNGGNNEGVLYGVFCKPPT